METEEGEKDVINHPPKDVTETSFASTVNILSSSHYTLPIDYPDSPSDDDNNGEKPIHHSPSIEEPLPISTSSLHGPGTPPVIQAHVSEELVSSVQEERHHSVSDVISSCPTSTTPTSDGSHEMALNLKTSETCPAGPVCPQTSIMVSSEEMINASVAYCDSTTVMTTVSTRTHYSQGSHSTATSSSYPKEATLSAGPQEKEHSDHTPPIDKELPGEDDFSMEDSNQVAGHNVISEVGEERMEEEEDNNVIADIPIVSPPVNFNEAMVVKSPDSTRVKECRDDMVGEKVMEIEGEVNDKEVSPTETLEQERETEKVDMETNETDDTDGGTDTSVPMETKNEEEENKLQSEFMIEERRDETLANVEGIQEEEEDIRPAEDNSVPYNGDNTSTREDNDHAVIATSNQEEGEKEREDKDDSEISIVPLGGKGEEEEKESAGEEEVIPPETIDQEKETVAGSTDDSSADIITQFEEKEEEAADITVHQERGMEDITSREEPPVIPHTDISVEQEENESTISLEMSSKESESKQVKDATIITIKQTEVLIEERNTIIDESESEAAGSNLKQQNVITSVKPREGSKIEEANPNNVQEGETGERETHCPNEVMNDKQHQEDPVVTEETHTSLPVEPVISEDTAHSSSAEEEEYLQTEDKEPIKDKEPVIIRVSINHEDNVSQDEGNTAELEGTAITKEIDTINHAEQEKREAESETSGLGAIVVHKESAIERHVVEEEATSTQTPEPEEPSSVTGRTVHVSDEEPVTNTDTEGDILAVTTGKEQGDIAIDATQEANTDNCEEGKSDTPPRTEEVEVFTSKQAISLTVNELPDTSNAPVSPLPTANDATDSSSDTETSSETESKLEPEPESQTLVPPVPVVLPSLSSSSPPPANSLQVMSSISSLFSTLPPFSSICASPISLSTSTQYTTAFSGSIAPSSIPSLTFGTLSNYRSKHPQHVSVLTSRSSRSLPSILTPPFLSDLAPPSSHDSGSVQATCSSSTSSGIIELSDDAIIVSGGTSLQTSPPSLPSPSSSSVPHTVLAQASTSVGPAVSVSTVSVPTVSVATPEGGSWGKGIKEEEEEWAGEGVDDVTAQQLKLAQQKLAMLKRHPFSPLYKPTDVSSLERVGSDSQNNMYWYDGGRNLYQSPPIWDPAAKPKESELVLVCKSFIQWQNKLKQLRSSCHESDSKLAQIIKQMYLSRVKIATKRKTKDPVAVSSSSQHQRNSSPLTTPSVAQSMATAATAAIQQASNLTSLQVPQGLPQGSILVVPSSTMLQGGGGAAGFSGVPLLPVFANTAVILPQNIQTQQPSSQFAASSQMRAFESHHHNIGGVRDSEVSRDSPVTGRRSKVESKGQAEDEVIIQRVEAPKNVYHPFPAVSMATNTATPLPPTHSFFSPVQLPKEGEESGKKQSHPFFALSKSQVSGGVEILKVEAESEMGFIDKNTKSLEILEEVPIRKISIESSLTAHEGTLLCHSSSPSLPSSSSCHINNGDPVTRGQANNVTTPTPCSQPSVSVATGAPTTGTLPSSIYSHTMSESNAIVALTELATKARTTQEVMSAKTLLSLHGPGGQPLLPQLVSLTPPTSSPGVPPSTARPKKTPRKQKPVASARSVVPGNHGNPSLAPPPHSIVVTGNNNKNVSPSSATPTVSETKTKKKEYTPEELLKILDIPLKPSQSSFDDIKKPNSSDTQTSRVSPQKSFESSQKDMQSGGLGKGVESRKDAPPSFYRVTESRNEALLSRQEGAESDSESTDSSSDNESSTDEEKERKGKKGQPVSTQRQAHAALPSGRVVPHTTVSSSSSSSSSTSSSSSEDSSDEELIQPKPSKGKKIGGVVGGGVKGKAPAAKRQKPSGRTNKELLRSVSRAVKVQAQKPQKPSPAATKKQQKGVALKRLQKKKPLPVVKSQAPPKKSRPQRPPSRQKKPTSLIVSILKRFLETAKRSERKRKQETDSENESDDTLSSNSADASPPPTKFTSRKQKEDTSSSTAPPDLKKYYNPDCVDLKTLRELTRSVVPERDGGSRSKRTCVRVREEIAKLQEMLDADGERILVPAGAQGKNNKSQPGGGVSVGKGSVKGGKRTKGSQGSSGKKKKVSQKEVSQFRSVSNSTRIKYVFSTQLANQAAEAVWRSKFESVIAFHKAQQVKGSKFLRLPGKETLGGTRGTWEANGRVNLRPRASVSKSNKTAGQKRSGGRGGRPNHTELRRSKRLAKTKEDSEKEEEEEEKEDEEEEEEEDEEEEEERPKLIRSAVRKKRSPLVPDDISTPSSDDVTSSASECNEEEEEEEKEEQPLAKHSPSVSPRYRDEEAHERERLSSHEATPQPRPSEPSYVAPSNQTPVQTPAGTPNQPPSKEDVNYTICHGTPEMRLPSASDVDHTPSSSQTHPQASIGQHSSIVMATSGTVSTGHMTWSSGFPHSQLHNAYPQIYSKLHPSAPTAMYPHQPYPYQVTYPWPHPPEHPDHAHQLSVAPAALPSNWPAPPTKDVGGKTSSGSSLSRPHYYSSSGKHSSSASHHHLPPGHFPFPPQPPGGGGGVNPAYGFESHHSSLAAAAHVWPPHQMPHPQLHSLVPAAAPHPAAHLAPQGIPWSAYPRHLQAPVSGHHHLGMERITGSGSVVIDKGGKSKDRKGESKIINSNNSNNNSNDRGFPLSWSLPASSKR